MGTAAPTSTAPPPLPFVVIGDIPYGEAQIALLPSWVDRINSEPDVGFVVHVGDIKDRTVPCSDTYNRSIKAQFNRFRAPLVYTPGDNEWSDCPDGGDAGGPAERLDAVRSTFFATPGRTLGKTPMKVTSDASNGYPENVLFCRNGAMFLTLNVVGSDNGLKPRGERTTPTTKQVAEAAARTEADVAHLRTAFARARKECPGAVVVFQQADMFSPGPDGVRGTGPAPFEDLVRALVAEARSFDGRVYLFNGDTHLYRVDQPLATGSDWLGFYDVLPVETLTQVTVDGDTASKDYLKVTLDETSTGKQLWWERVPYDPARS
ncbi:MAG: metallophosphoesterase [Terracoccus sp.]